MWTWFFYGLVNGESVKVGCVQTTKAIVRAAKEQIDRLPFVISPNAILVMAKTEFTYDEFCQLVKALGR